MAGVLLAAASPADAVNGPLAPCEPSSPTYPVFADPPRAQNWHNSELGPGWSPADCVSWAVEPFTILTALAGRFEFAGSGEDLALRFGAFSAWRGMLYWSVTDKRYQTLVTDAAALSGPDSSLRRPDFTLSELRSGADLYFMQQDNRSSDRVVYRLRVLAIGNDRLVVTVANVTQVSVFIFTAFDPGDLKSTYIFIRLSPTSPGTSPGGTSWGYYSLSGAREGAALLGSHGSSYLNRALAIYRHLAGLPGDQGPPLAE
ncbi:MAG TPA: DUF6675 family protein [Dongiaceae bacterium]|jgi:hypothetical protein